MPDTTASAAPTILSAFDDVGPEQGQIVHDQMTDDTSLSYRVSLTNAAPGADPIAVGDTISVTFSGSWVVGQATVTSADLAAGFITVPTTNAPPVGVGRRPIEVHATDAAGNVSPSSTFLLDFSPAGGMTRTAMTDGGWVEEYTIGLGSDATTDIQRYDSAGHAVGSSIQFSYLGYIGEHSVTALPGGNYVALFHNGDHFTTYNGSVVGPNGTVLNNVGVGGFNVHVTVGAHGGFATTLNNSVTLAPGVQDFDNNGVAMSNALFLSGPITTLDANADGTFTAHFNDFGDASRPRTLTLDPTVHSNLTTPTQAPPVNATDDVGPQTGTLSYGATTDDATPTLHVGSAAGGAVYVSWSNGPNSNHASIVQTPGSTGDVTTPLTDGEGQYNYSVRYETAEGLVSPTTFFSLVLQSADHAGTAGADTETAQANGSWMTGQGGADIFVFNTQPTRASTITDFTPGADKLDFRGLLASVHYAGSNPFADGYITYASPNGVGQTNVAFDPDGAAGAAPPVATVLLQNVTADKISAGDFIVSGSPPPPPPPPAGGGQVISGQGQETGGAGNDTLVGAISGNQTMTGAGGADSFRFDAVPAQPDHITDFVIGTDRIDLSPVFAAIGYTGSDPVADGYVKLINAADSGEGTWVYIDRDGPGTADQWGTYAFEIDHVHGPGAAGHTSTLTWSDLTAGTASPPPPPASPPPPPPPPPPSPPPPPVGAGQQVTESSSNHTLTGGAGDDTLTALHGGDTMTGGGGADRFTFGAVPWSPSEITDFTKGADKLDLSQPMADFHYAGSDPIADGWIKLIDDGHGNTWVYFDSDGHGATDQWGTFVATLDHVAASSITDADLVLPGAGSPPPPASPPPPPPAGGGGQQVTETSPNQALGGGAGDDTLTAFRGGDTMTGAGGADHFAFQALPWNPNEIADFTPGTDKLDLSRQLSDYHYAGTDPIGDGWVKLIDDGHGDTWLYFDTDGRGTGDQWGTFMAKIDHVAPAVLTAGDFIFH